MLTRHNAGIETQHRTDVREQLDGGPAKLITLFTAGRISLMLGRLSAIELACCSYATLSTCGRKVWLDRT